jgi:Ca-activated chloride channel homolog
MKLGPPAASVFLSVACFVSAAGQAAEGPGEYKISTDARNVVLPTTVIDRKGEFVNGLTEQNFQVFDDGKPQEIRYFSHNDIPVTIGLVVDSSGSMRPKRGDTVLAALHFVRVSNPRDEMFVVNFNERVELGLPAGIPFAGDVSTLRAALINKPCTGRTAMYDALAVALDHLSAGSCDKKALVLVSDGGDNASRRGFQEVLAAAQKSNAIIYTIGLFDPDDPDRNPGILKKLAKATGGEAYLPEKTAELGEIATHIAQDLRHQYTLAYAPSTSARSSYHRVQVVATAPGQSRLSARTRPGYFLPERAPQETKRVEP